MKKMLFILAAIFMFSISAEAQRKVLSMGVKAGMNFSNASEFITQIEDGSVTSRTDFTGGLFFELRPLANLSLSVDALYSGQGYKFNGTMGSSDISGEVKLHYFNFPILANFYLVDGLAVKAGVQYGFNTGQDIHFAGLNTDWKDAIDKADVSIPVGISYNFNFGLIVDARYNFGVKDISVDSVGDIVLGNTKSRVFTVTLGYRF